ncbi:MAG TPA: tRNA (adenosine(37)-N6)-dimethylallyltransferase MiaA [Gammaproteobacteria bacterium]
MREYEQMKSPAIFLMGPTASGKTGAAIAVAKRFPVELVNVDSAQIYRGMDIGTAKPDRETRARYPHRLMDILDPSERYSAARFREDALREMREITAGGRVPLLVGGTGLYFRALERGLADMPPANPELREAIDSEARQKGWAALHAELLRVDPEAAARIAPTDPQRIQRALEIFRLTGEPMSTHWKVRSSEAQTGEFPWQVLKIALAPRDRTELHRRIEARFHAMMAAGFLEEVRGLKARGDLDPGMASTRAVGYRQLWEHLAGEYDLDEAVRRGIVASRRYAKRQMTWFRGEADLRWVDDESSLLARVSTFLEGRPAV